MQSEQRQEEFIGQIIVAKNDKFVCEKCLRDECDRVLKNCNILLLSGDDGAPYCMPRWALVLDAWIKPENLLIPMSTSSQNATIFKLLFINRIKYVIFLYNSSPNKFFDFFPGINHEKD